MKFQKYGILAILLLVTLAQLYCSGKSDNTDTGNRIDISLSELYSQENYTEIVSRLFDDGTLKDLSRDELLYLGSSALQLYGKDSSNGNMLSTALDSLERCRTAYFESLAPDIQRELLTALVYANFYSGRYQKVISYANEADGISDSANISSQSKLAVVIAISQMNLGNYSLASEVLGGIADASYDIRILQYRAALMNGDEITAKESLESALSYASNEIERFNAGMILVNHQLESGDTDGAVDEAWNVLDSISSNLLASSIYYLLGNIYNDNGEKIEARTMWNRSIELNPDNTYTQEKL